MLQTTIQKTRSLGAALLSASLLLTSLPAAAGVAEALHGLSMGASLETAQEKIRDQCETWELRTTNQPTFPAAESTEAHLVCTGLTIGGRRVEETAFTFADGSLALVEARGGAVEALTPYAEGEPQEYLGYEAYRSDLMLLSKAKDAVWLLTPETAHAHLFGWSNPNLPSNRPQRPESSVAPPPLLKFGATLEELTPLFDEACTASQREVVAEPWLATNPREQVQVNCYGIVYAGFPRKIEAVFGDGRLELAWILMGKGEEGRLRDSLTAQFGEARFVYEGFEAFQGWKVALRKDKPEILFLSDELASDYRRTYEGAGGKAVP